jgi:serine/threonine-protein kinase
MPPNKSKQEQKLRDEAFGYHAGEVINGKYELVRVLGQGGMAAVWVVQNLILDAQFALKMLANDGGESHGDERMLREARAAAAIEHPAIIKVFDFGITERGDPFIVMELLLGESLKDMMAARRRMAPVEAVRLLLPIADALAVAHGRGVVHRDIKPDNIVCVKDEVGRIQPKIVDFGIAKRLESDWERITQYGSVIGTPEYLSPEQAKDEPNIDHRTDIWSFSAVLYEMLTGRTPFYRDNIPSMLQAITQEPVVPLARFGVQESELSALVLRGLHKFPQARWEDMRSYGRALAQWLVRHGIEEDVTTQSVRVTWLGGASQSAPPVSIDRFPELRPPRVPQGLPQAHFPGFDEAYEVPKKGFFQTTTGVGLAGLGVAAVVATGLFVAGVFDQQPVAAHVEPQQPVAAAANPPPPAPIEPVAMKPDEPSEEAAKPDAGVPDAGFAPDSGIADATPDVFTRRSPPPRPAPRQAARSYAPRISAPPPPPSPPAPASENLETSTRLPEVKQPVDVNPAPDSYRTAPGSSAPSATNGKTDKSKRNWGY